MSQHVIPFYFPCPCSPSPPTLGPSLSPIASPTNHQATPSGEPLPQALKGPYAQPALRQGAPLLEPILLSMSLSVVSLAVGVSQKRQKPQKGLIPTSHHLCSLQTCIISSCLCSIRSFQQLPTAPKSKPRPFPGIRTPIRLILTNLPALLLPTRPHGPDCSHPGFSL